VPLALPKCKLPHTRPALFVCHIPEQVTVPVPATRASEAVTMALALAFRIKRFAPLSSAVPKFTQVATSVAVNGTSRWDAAKAPKGNPTV